MTPSSFVNDTQKMNITLRLLCPRSNLSHPTTTSLSSRIAGYTPKLGFPFLSNTLFCPKSSLLLLRSSTYGLYLSLHCTTRNLKQFTPRLSRPAIRSKPRFSKLYTTDNDVFIGAPTESGKTICAEFALLRLWSKRKQPRAVCIEPYQEMVDQRVMECWAKFEKLQGGKEIVSLTGETSADLRQMEKGDVIVCTPTQVRQIFATLLSIFFSLN